MKPADILGRYAYYYETLQKLGGRSLSDAPSIENLKLSRAVIMSVYRDIDKEKFKGGFIDYLCWVSTRYLMHLAEASSKKIADFAVEKRGEYPADVNNLLRLVNRNPSHLFQKNDFEEYIKVAWIWYDVFFE